MSRGANLTTLKTKVTSLSALTLHNAEYRKVTNYVETLKRALAIKLVSTTDYTINIKANVIYLTLNFFYHLKAISWYKRKLRKKLRPNRRKKVYLFQKAYHVYVSRRKWINNAENQPKNKIFKYKKVSFFTLKQFREGTKRIKIKKKLLNPFRKNYLQAPENLKVLNLYAQNTFNLEKSKKQKKINKKKKQKRLLLQKQNLTFKKNRLKINIKYKSLKNLGKKKLETKAATKEEKKEEIINFSFTFKKVLLNAKSNIKSIKKNKSIFLKKYLIKTKQWKLAYNLLFRKRKYFKKMKNRKKQKIKKLKMKKKAKLKHKIKSKNKNKKKKLNKHQKKIRKSKQIKQLRLKRSAEKKKQKQRRARALLSANKKLAVHNDIRDISNKLQKKINKRNFTTNAITSKPDFTTKAAKNILFDKKHTQPHKFKWRFFNTLCKNKTLVLKTKNLNKNVNKKVTHHFTFKFRKYKRLLFNRRFHFYYDVWKLSSLLLRKKITAAIYVKIIGQIFKKLPKTLHNQFFKLLRDLIIELTSYNLKEVTKSKLQGLKFIIKGKLKGKMRANVWNFSHGKLVNQSPNTFIETSKLTVNTMYGSFGFSGWFSYQSKSQNKEILKRCKKIHLRKKNLNMTKLKEDFFRDRFQKFYKNHGIKKFSKKRILLIKMKKIKIKTLFKQFTAFLSKKPKLQKNKIVTQHELKKNMREKGQIWVQNCKYSNIKTFVKKLHVKKKPKEFYIKKWYKKNKKKKILPELPVKPKFNKRWNGKKPYYNNYNKNYNNYNKPNRNYNNNYYYNNNNNRNYNKNNNYSNNYNNNNQNKNLQVNNNNKKPYNNYYNNNKNSNNNKQNNLNKKNNYNKNSGFNKNNKVANNNVNINNYSSNKTNANNKNNYIDDDNKNSKNIKAETNATIKNPINTTNSKKDNNINFKQNNKNYYANKNKNSKKPYYKQDNEKKPQHDHKNDHKKNVNPNKSNTINTNKNYYNNSKNKSNTYNNSKTPNNSMKNSSNHTKSSTSSHNNKTTK